MPGAIVIESEHNYPDHANSHEWVELAGAVAIGIVFDPQTKTESNYDYITFHKVPEGLAKEKLEEENAAKKEGKDVDKPIEFPDFNGKEKYCGDFPNFPSKERPFVIVGDKFVHSFRSDGSTNFWGYRFVAYPMAEYLSPFDMVLAKPGAQTCETAHEETPKTTKVELFEKIEFPGAYGIAIGFADETKIPSEASFKIYKQDPDPAFTIIKVGSEYDGTSLPVTAGKEEGSEAVGALEKDGTAELVVKDKVAVNDKGELVEGDWFEQQLAEAATVEVESAHPYPDNANSHETVEVPGEHGMFVVFDPQSTTESNYDFVRFYKDDGHSEFWGEDKYSGGRGGSGKNFPMSLEDPLYIPANKLVLHFCSDGSNNDWGYKIKFYAAPEGLTAPPFSRRQIVAPPSLAGSWITTKKAEVDVIPPKVLYERSGDSSEQWPGAGGADYLRLHEVETFYVSYSDAAFEKSSEEGAEEPGPRKEWGFKMAAFPEADELKDWAGELGEMYESPHPYLSNTNADTEVSFEGATYVEVAFDKRSATEANCDYMRFYADPADTETPLPDTEPKYTGRGGSQNFPTMDAPLKIKVDEFFFKFYSDGSNEDWGYKMAIRPIITEDEEEVEPEVDPFTAMGQAEELRKKRNRTQLFWAKSLFYMTLDAEFRDATSTYELHDYTANMNKVDDVMFPGATEIKVEFSKETFTEYQADTLEFNKPSAAEGGICCPNGHTLQLSDGGFGCDARNEPDGCRCNGNVEGQQRWQCRTCDFDYCGACYEYKGMAHKCLVAPGVPAKFSGKYAPTYIASQGERPIEDRTTGWPTFTDKSDHMVAKFSSDATSEEWGYSFVATPTYEAFDGPEAGDWTPASIRQACMDGKLFEVLMGLATKADEPVGEAAEKKDDEDEPAEEDDDSDGAGAKDSGDAAECQKFAALTVCNVMRDSALLDAALAFDGGKWVKALLSHPGHSVKLLLLRSILGDEGKVEPRVRKLISELDMLPDIQSLMLSPISAIKSVATAILSECLGGGKKAAADGQGDGVESALLDCLSSDIQSVQERALDRLARIAKHDAEGRELIIKLGAVRQIQEKLLALPTTSAETRMQAVLTLRDLLQTEETVTDFLFPDGEVGGGGDGGGAAVSTAAIRALLEAADNVGHNATGLGLIHQLLTKHASNEARALEVQKPTDSLMLGKACCFNTASPGFRRRTTDEKKNRRGSVAEDEQVGTGRGSLGRGRMSDAGGSAATPFLSVSFWLYAEGFPENTSTPLLAKAKPTYRLANNTGTTKVLMGDVEVRKAGKSYYEVTVETQGEVQVGWCSKSFVVSDHIGSKGIRESDFAYGLSSSGHRIWGGLDGAKYEDDQNVHVGKEWTNQPNTEAVIGVMLDLDTHEMEFSVDGVSVGPAVFSGRDHGRKTRGTGVEWDSDAFRPIVALEPGQVARVNFGQEPFKHMPAEYAAVKKCVPTDTCPVLLMADTAAKAFAYPKYEQQDIFQAAEEEGAGALDDSIAVHLLPTMRASIAFTAAGGFDEATGEPTETRRVQYTTSSMIMPKSWTHVRFYMDSSEDDLKTDLYVNGKVDAQECCLKMSLVNNAHDLIIGQALGRQPDAPAKWLTKVDWWCDKARTSSYLMDGERSPQHFEIRKKVMEELVAADLRPRFGEWLMTLEAQVNKPDNDVEEDDASGTTIESKHPYDNNANEDHLLEVPEAEAMIVWFDPQSTTEANYDFVRFYERGPDSDDGRGEQFGEDKYSGRKDSNNFPTKKNPLRIPRGQVYVHFESDGSNNDWGFKVFAAEAPEIKEAGEEGEGGPGKKELQRAIEALRVVTDYATFFGQFAGTKLIDNKLVASKVAEGGDLGVGLAPEKVIGLLLDLMESVYEPEAAAKLVWTKADVARALAALSAHADCRAALVALDGMRRILALNKPDTTVIAWNEITMSNIYEVKGEGSSGDEGEGEDEEHDGAEEAKEGDEAASMVFCFDGPTPPFDVDGKLDAAANPPLNLLPPGALLMASHSGMSAFGKIAASCTDDRFKGGLTQGQISRLRKWCSAMYHILTQVHT